MKLVFDKFHARMQCFVALLAAIAVFERYLAQQFGLAYTPTEYKTVVAAAHEVPAYIRVKKDSTRRLLSEYFRPAGDPLRRAELTKRNYVPVTPKILEFLQDFIEKAFLTEHSPIGKACAGALGNAQEQELAQRIQRFTKAELEELIEAIDEVEPEDKGDASILPFLEETLGEVNLPHPDFPCLALFDVRALKVEFHGFDLHDEPAEKNWGLYSIIREPRGWAAEHKEKINSLVRDTLWLSPRVCTKDEPRGFYTSAFDNDAFVIDDLRSDEDTVIAQGILAGSQESAEPTQRTRVVFSKFRRSRSLEASHGLVAGTAGDGRSPTFAAWKALIIRPDWQNLNKLQGVLFQLDQSAQSVEEDAALAYKLLSDDRASGVLYSEKLKKRFPDFPDMSSRRRIFRSLIASDRTMVTSKREVLGDFLSKRLSDEFEIALTALHAGKRPATGQAAAAAALRDTKAISELMMATLSNYVERVWHQFEPTQLIMFKSADYSAALSTPEIRAQLQTLMSKHAIGDHSDVEPPAVVA